MKRTPCLPTASCAMLLALWLSAPAARAQTSHPDFPPIPEATKGYQAQRGFISLYVQAKKNRVLAEIPGALQKKPMLLATSITGGEYTGWQWNDQMVYWERLDRKLLLVEPQINYRARGGTLTGVVKRTYRDRVITALPIIGQGAAGSVLVDFTSLFGARSSLFIGSLASGVDSSLTKIAKVKAFPHNVEIELDLAQIGRKSTSGASGIAVHYSLSALPKTGYQPRAADDRIGYFLTAYKDLAKGPNADTTFVRFINRWHLEKADPTLKLSPPKEPIVFYIEKTVPIRYRRYVREGILEWNKAFEKIGIIDAIDVRQQTDTQFADLDPEDVRYNFFRWITSENSFAMGPSRVHPMTGQILDADIIFDDSMVRSWFDEYARLIQKGPVKEFHPALRRFLAEHPERHPMRRWRTARDEGVGRRLDPASADDARPDGARPPGEFYLHAPRTCEFGAGMQHQVNFATTVLRTMVDEIQAQPGLAGEPKSTWPEEFLGQVIKEVVMHETGHTLGLRHNFKASSWLSLDEINKAEKPPAAQTGSVMDYNPTNISPPGKPQGFWNTRTLGPYDYWAIEYGYTFEKDPKKLTAIASRGAEKGLDYATDEDTTSSDPYVNRFDMGADPLDFCKRRVALVRKLLENLVARVVKPGEGYQKARKTFGMLLYEYERVSRFAVRFVGGNRIHRDHKGDPKARPPVQPVPAAKQREALDFLLASLFSRDAFAFGPDLYNFLAVGRWYHWGSSDSRKDPEYPIHDRILQVQLWTLFGLLNPRRLTLVADGELRVGPDTDALTLPELFEKLTRAIWTEADSVPEGKFTNRKPLITSLRRNLQNEYIGELIRLALEDDSGPSPQSARAQAALQLRRLLERVTRMADAARTDTAKLDDYSLAHILAAKERIAKALDASYSRDGGGVSSGGFLIIGHPSTSE